MAADLASSTALIASSIAELIAAGEANWERVRQTIKIVLEASGTFKNSLRECGGLTARETTPLLAPLPSPGILLSHGRAYRSHITEMAGGSKTPDMAPSQPIGFLKNRNSIIGPGESIVLPSAAPDQVDFEGEIAVVFARACHGAMPETAMEHVFGFTIVNDVSARDWVPEMSKHPDLNRMGKQFATFAPMGPCVTTCDEISDLTNLHLTTRLNGEVMQDAYTRDLIWSFPELIAYYSRWYPFQAGDVLTSGTPAGVGFGRSPKVFLRAGDTVSVCVDGVGELVNSVVASGT
jgi:acylpyruvate hydrolase